MNGNRLPSHPSDTLIGIVIATIGTLVLLGRLNVFTIGFNLPGDLVTWWPLLLISLGIVLLAAWVVPCPVRAANTNTPAKREAASAQFARAQEMRAALNEKAAEKRTLADYKRVVATYQRVYLITPHAMEVADATVAVGELNTEMGDRFGRSYYQAAAEAYQFLIREYPTSKFVPDAMLRMAQLQKDQLGDPAAATKTYQDFQKKYPLSIRYNSHLYVVQSECICPHVL